MRVARRHGTISSAVQATSGARPVMLVTFDVPFVPEAAVFAVDSAVESGQPLLVVNVAEVPILPISIAMGYEYVGTRRGRGCTPCAGGAGQEPRRRRATPAGLQPASR